MDNELLERRRQLESGFATENWSRLNYQQRLELCRELENNYAAERGVAPCYITAEEMEDGTYGYQSGRSIVLNSHVLEDGTFHVTLRDENDQPLLGEDGRPVEKAVPIPAANWAVMETVYHEGTHGVQEAQGRLAWTYFSAEDDYALYRIQSCEKEASSEGVSRTLDAIRAYEAESGKRDLNSEAYIKSAAADSFQPYLDDAAERYNDPNIEQTLNQFISDRDNGVTPENPSESYQAIAGEYDKAHGLSQDADDPLAAENDGADAAALGAGAGAAAALGGEASETGAEDGYGVEGTGTDVGYGMEGTGTDDGYGAEDLGADDGYGMEDSGTDDGYGVEDTGTDDGYGVGDLGADDGYGVEDTGTDDGYGAGDLGTDDGYGVSDSGSDLGAGTSSGGVSEGSSSGGMEAE